MKKSLLILLVASMFFVFAACNNAADPNANTDDDVQKADDPKLRSSKKCWAILLTWKIS